MTNDRYSGTTRRQHGRVDVKASTSNMLAQVQEQKQKGDSQHHPTINSCLVRIPGTINSKCSQTVQIIQRWEGQRLDKLSIARFQEMVNKCKARAIHVY